MKKSWTITGFTLITAILAGACAGIVGSIMTDQSIERYIASLERQDNFVTLSREKPRALPGSHEEAVDRVIELAQPTLAGFRKRSNNATTRTQWVFEGDMVGFGAVVTNDGWVLFHSSVIDEVPKLSDGEVWIQGNRYIPERMIADSVTDLVLVKVAARDLPTSAFGGAEAMRGGELLFALTAWREVQVSSLVDGDSLVNREPQLGAVFTTAWEMGRELAISAPVFNSAGELVGLSSGGLSATPLHHAMPFIRTSLKDGNPQHAGIGAYIVHGAHIVNLPESVRLNGGRGAVITAPNRGAAVIVGSSAASAGLKENDVLLALDDVLVTEHQTLPELLANYTVGSTVNVRILREKQEISLKLTLDSFEE